VFSKEGKGRFEYAFADGAGDVLGLKMGPRRAPLRFLDLRHFLLAFGTTSYHSFRNLGTISYRERKRYSSSLAMIKPKILVTGATGKTGGAVVTELLAKDWPVRAAVRVQDARSDLLQRRGAEVVVADTFNPSQLMDAMRGVQRAYYCPPYHPFVIQSASAFAVAAREMGLEQIVGLSQWIAGPNHPALMTRQLWLIDRMYAALPNVAHTVVNPGFFAESPYLEMMPFAAHLGVFPLPVAGESRDAPPSVADIARVAVAALLDPARHAGKSYRLTGSKLLSVLEMTAVIGQVIGHKVRHVGPHYGYSTRPPRRKAWGPSCSAASAITS
jgi:uncharacterized protein YbjT (DUF2867 family)